MWPRQPAFRLTHSPPNSALQVSPQQPCALRVRALRRTGEGSLTVAIEFDDGSRLRVHERRVHAHGLTVGSEVDPALQAVLERGALADDAERRLLRLVGRRARSRSELERRLSSTQLDEDEASEILDRLDRLGLVNDAALADEVDDRLSAGGRGRLSISHTLRRLEVDPKVAAAVLERPTHDLAGETERAREVLARRFGAGALAPADLPACRGVPRPARIRTRNGVNRARTRPRLTRVQQKCQARMLQCCKRPPLRPDRCGRYHCTCVIVDRAMVLRDHPNSLVVVHIAASPRGADVSSHRPGRAQRRRPHRIP